MADVSGPTSYLPGQILSTPTNMACDDHPDRPAVKRVVGEVDSFGAEYIDMCQECFDAYQKGLEASINEECQCDWCKKSSTDCKYFRDAEEGSRGPVYRVCASCREMHLKHFMNQY